MSVVTNGTRLQPADMSASSPVDSVLSAVAVLLGNLSGWKLVASLLLAIVIYDQGNKKNWLFSLMRLVKYQMNRKGIAGPRWKIPIMGSFLDSLHPTFEGYLSKWESGPLSCVSVFHKYPSPNNPFF